MFHVVGSGPAGVAVARALVRRGQEVTLIDSGLDLEPSRKTQVEELKELPEKNWTLEKLQFLKDGQGSDPSGIPEKRVYGSDFPYQRTQDFHQISSDALTQVKSSLARGGLSNVWGAAMLPYSRGDIQDWPIPFEDWESEYREVLEYVPLSAPDERLREFPLHTETVSKYQPSRLANQFMKHLEGARENLQEQGFRFGYSRLALREGCTHCGLCLYGCPYGYIYNSRDTLKELIGERNFHYRSGWVLQKFNERNGRVSLKGLTLEDSQEEVIESERVFLATGALPTTKILLESNECYDQSVLMKDSQYFIAPLLSYRGTPGVEDERLHTLSQIFLELEDSQISPQTIHLQLYTYNDLYSGAMRTKLKFLYPLLKAPSRAMLERMMVVQGYLHSDSSSRLKIQLKRTGELQVCGVSNPEVKRRVEAIVAKLSRMKKNLHAVPIKPLLQVGKVGHGNHIGGSFPMSDRPERFQSDLLGRPFGYERVHAVDASVFPSLPATTITLSVMANATRIGKKVLGG